MYMGHFSLFIRVVFRSFRFFAVMRRKVFAMAPQKFPSFLVFLVIQTVENSSIFTLLLLFTSEVGGEGRVVVEERGREGGGRGVSPH